MASGAVNFLTLPTMSQIKAIYYPLLAAVGVPVTAVTIAILCRGKCGLSRGVTRYLVAMATADLLVVVTDVAAHRIVALYFPVSWLDITPLCSLRNVLLSAATESSVWLTVAFTSDRFVAICYPRLKARYCTPRTAGAVIGAVGALFSLKNVPWYFVYEPRVTVGGTPWFCKLTDRFFASLPWTIFSWFDRVLTPCVPFLLILLLNALTVRHILVASRVRKSLRGLGDERIHKDPEMQNRKRSIVLLFSISGSFVLLWTTYIVVFLYLRITRTFRFSGSHSRLQISQEVGSMLVLLSCCSNTCVYGATQHKFREELKKGLRYPLERLARLLRTARK